MKDGRRGCHCEKGYRGDGINECKGKLDIVNLNNLKYLINVSCTNEYYF